MNSSRKRIVIFSLGFTPWVHGAEMTALEITKRLKERYEFFVITYRFASSTPHREIIDGTHVIRIGPFPFGKFIWPFLAALYARNIRPGLAHAIFESYPGAALFFFRILAPRTPTLLTLQSGNIGDPRMRYGILQRMGRLLLLGPIHRRPNRLTALSRALVERAKTLGVSGERLTIIPNGVDLSRIPQGTTERARGKILSVGRLAQEKGFPFLIRAFAEVKHKVPQATLDIIGEGPERERLQTQIQELHLQESVRLLGSLPHDAVLEAMRRAELFALPSLAEGLGIVFIEAQACGTPVIGTNAGGIPDVITNGETGLLVPPRDPQALTGAIVRLLGDKKFARELAERAQNSLGRFSWQTIVKSYARAYAELLR